MEFNVPDMFLEIIEKSCAPRLNVSEALNYLNLEISTRKPLLGEIVISNTATDHPETIFFHCRKFLLE